MVEGEYNVVIGRITSPFGRKGEVKVQPFTDFPEHFEELEEIYVADKSGGRMIEIEKAWLHKGAVIIKFAGINDISTAETLRDKEVCIREAEMMELAEDEYYVHDIIGMDVVTTEGESLGKVTEVLRSPANDVYVTDKAMIPAVKEFVEKIDTKDRKIIVRPVPGLVQE